jgi:hypothetical protein
MDCLQPIDCEPVCRATSMTVLLLHRGNWQFTKFNLQLNGNITNAKERLCAPDERHCCLPIVCRRPLQGVQAAALATKPGVIATLLTDHLLGGATGGLDDKAQFLVANGIGHLVVPLLCGWAVTTAMRTMAQGARRWVTSAALRVAKSNDGVLAVSCREVLQ